MKRKPKVHKIIPYILAFLFWRYSNLNAEQTAMIIIMCGVFYAMALLIVDAWIETEGKD